MMQHQKIEKKKKKRDVDKKCKVESKLFFKSPILQTSTNVRAFLGLT